MSINEFVFPRVTLEVRAMGETITAAFADHAGAVSEEVTRGVKAAVENFNFEAEVRRCAQPIIAKAISSAIERYFWGDGAALLDRVVREALLKMADNKRGAPKKGAGI